jgi:hypothetical protein
MPTSTTNYGLIKPGTDDPILVGQLNDNMDTIDTVLKDHSDKIDAAALGIKYKGEVNYYADLPNNAEIGDAYTVKYAGSSGTTPDGTEYVWGTVSGTNQWINFSKDSYTKAEVDALLALKQNALSSTQLDAVNSGIDSEKVAQYDSTTELEAKDRAALVELVDSGAKNKIFVDKLNTTNANGVTYTINSDGTITVNGTPSGSSPSYAVVAMPDGSTYKNFAEFCNGDNILSGCPTGGSNNTYRMYITGTGYTREDFGTGVELTDTSVSPLYLILYIYNGYTADNLTFKPMICNKSAWDISQKYVPYVPTNAELYEMIKAL